MNEQPHSFFRRGPRLVVRAVLFILLGVCVLATDARYGVLTPVRNTLAMVLAPLQYGARLPRDAVIAADNYVKTLASLEADNRRLRQQLHMASVRSETQQQLLAENSDLRRLLGLRARGTPKLTAASIIYIGNDPFQHKVTIGKGRASGIVPGSPVIDDTGVVGQVTRAYTLTSEITLVTDRDQAVPVQDVRTGLRAVVFGTGEPGVLNLPYQAANADIRVGDQLVTSGVDGIYPPGLPVATVQSVEHNSGMPFARVVCRPVTGVDRNLALLVLSVAPDKLLELEPPQPATPAPKSKKKGHHS